MELQTSQVDVLMGKGFQPVPALIKPQFHCTIKKHEVILELGFDLQAIRWTDDFCLKNKVADFCMSSKAFQIFPSHSSYWLPPKKVIPAGEVSDTQRGCNVWSTLGYMHKALRMQINGNKDVDSWKL